MNLPERCVTNARYCSSYPEICDEEFDFYDPCKEPFTLHGLCFEDGAFRRMPWEIAHKVSPKVYSLSSHTSGGRLRFTTESPAECAAIFRGYLEGNAQPPQNMTRGLFYRGVE